MNEELNIMANMVLESFRDQNKKIATAESCTGGLIATCLTDIAGSSDVVDCGFIAYSNEAKQRMLGVSSDVLAEFGAVSGACALEMAAGALENSQADATVSVTGIAGPGGGTSDKPIGLVHIAVATKNYGSYQEEFRFEPALSRSEIRIETVKAAFEMLLAYGLEDDD
jgi:nicotinamide-nucleotide amidase